MMYSHPIVLFFIPGSAGVPPGAACFLGAAKLSESLLPLFISEFQKRQQAVSEGVLRAQKI
jgi:hypothetical protein